MKTTKILYLAAFALVALGSCKDEDAATDLITNGAWKLVDSLSDTDGDGDIESDIEDCDKDDETTFKSDGTVTTVYGSDKCDPAEPATESGQWVLLNNDKTITLTVGGIGISGDLTELTDKRMVIRYEFEFGGNTTVSETVFEH
jgi:hypothetical protein